MDSGALSVMTTGMSTTPWWCAGKWAYLLKEPGLSPMLTLDVGRGLLFLTTCSAVDKRRTSLTAPIMDCLFTTVGTTRMLESGVRVSTCTHIGDC